MTVSKAISMTYDGETKKATITFPNGRRLTLSDVSEEQANDFVARHAPEFERRDCVLHTTGGIEVRGHD